MQITINDLITACLSATLKQYFEQVGDKSTDTMQVVLPANIRFGHYKDVKHIKLENKFAPITLSIPLFSSVNDACKAIPKVTSKLRTAF